MCVCVSMPVVVYVHACVRVSVFTPLLFSPNCCLLSHCQSDYEILFNLLGARVLCDFDESDLLFLHSLYCLVVRCRTPDSICVHVSLGGCVSVCVCVREYNHMNTTVKVSHNSDEILSS